MKILVCITQVPDTTTRIQFTDNNTKFNKAGVQFITGPYDDYALSRAVELKEAHGGTVTVLNVGEADLAKVVAVLPSMKAPTVSQLFGNAGGYAVETVVPKDTINVLIPALKDAGATDLIELPLSKIVH